MNNKTSLSLLLLFISLYSFAQVNDDSIRQVVLKNNITDSLYIFGEWNETDGTETHLNYLGVIKTNNGSFKIMTSCWLWGLSKRATNRILVFSESNNYLGNYNLVTKADLPERIENNQLVFLHSTSNSCDKEIITRLLFENGIPEDFFLECEDGLGDIYSFEHEK